MWIRPQTREQLDHMTRSAYRAMMLMRRWTVQYSGQPLYATFAEDNERTLRELLALRHSPRFRNLI